MVSAPIGFTTGLQRYPRADAAKQIVRPAVPFPDNSGHKSPGRSNTALIGIK
jgi:hypothetical protein